MERESRSVREKWAAPSSGASYATRRFASERAAARDACIVGDLLRVHGVRGPVLDAPCGTGRLQHVLASFGTPLVGLDVSDSMLAAARQQGGSRWVLGSIDSMPFAERSFDVVVACRYLHHLHEPRELERAVSELVRVSSRLVIASFWDAASLPALRVRLGLRRGEGPRGRTATQRAALEDQLQRAGAAVVEFRSTLRFFSQQTFFVARRR